MKDKRNLTELEGEMLALLCEMRGWAERNRHANTNEVEMEVLLLRIEDMIAKAKEAYND